MCRQGGVECDAEFFENRDSWFEHELQKHRSEYTCVWCRSAIFSHTDFQGHILKVHGDFSDAQLQMLQEGGRKCPTQFEARDCPFCDEWAEKLLQKSTSGSQPFNSTQGILVNHKRFKRHVASHQEQLAIFAVPRTNEDEDLPMSGSITHSVEAPTSIATNINAPQDKDVEGENVLEQNTDDIQDDISSEYSTTSKDDMLIPQQTNAFFGVGYIGGVQGNALVHDCLKKLEEIDDEFRSKWLPLCLDYIEVPPKDPKKRENEHRKISETVLKELVLKLDGILDGIETEGIEEIRQKRKEQVRRIKEVLNRMDAAKAS